MTARQRLFFLFVLVCLGAGWGFTIPMSKIAVSTGYPHFGLIFWQLVIGTGLMAVIALARGIRLPLSGRHLRFYVFIALIGTVFPNSASYQSAVHLPAGIMSILLSMIPMFAFPIAMALNIEKFDKRRLLGLSVGLCAALLIVLPDAQIDAAVSPFWVCVVLFTCMCYAFEGNFVAKWGTEGLDALQVLFGASLIGALIALPLALGTGQWIDPTQPWSAPNWALVASSVAHVLVYAGYVWLVTAAGPIFATQVPYLVTLFGLFWSKAILGESYSSLIWLSLALMVLGMYLVQPRRKDMLAQT